MGDPNKRALILKLKTDDPSLSTKDIKEEVGCSGRYARRVLERFYYNKKPREKQAIKETAEGMSEDEFYKLAMMAGLKKKAIKLKYRQMLADLVMNVEHNLSRHIPSIDLGKSSSKKETAVSMISDIHAGKLSYDDEGNVLYNKDICAFRLALLRARIIKLLTEHLRLENMDEFVVLLLGDLIDGSGVYPNQELNQDLTCFSDQISLAVAGIWDIIRGVRKLGLDVRVYGVPGNHARQGQFAPANNNLDYIVYQMLYMLSQYEDQDVTIHYSTVTPYLNLIVKDYRVHMRHAAPQQSETPSARAKLSGWKDIHKWDIFCYAHKHHPGDSSFMGADVFMNGAPVGRDDLSEDMGRNARPSQTLFGVAPKIGTSFKYNIYLDEYGDGKEANKLLHKYPRLGAK